MAVDDNYDKHRDHMIEELSFWYCLVQLRRNRFQIIFIEVGLVEYANMSTLFIRWVRITSERSIGERLCY